MLSTKFEIDRENALFWEAEDETQQRSIRDASHAT